MAVDDSPFEPQRRDLFSLAAEIFEAARQLRPAARGAFVEGKTAGDPDLRAEVLRLLAHADAPDSALAAAVGRAAAALAGESLRPSDRFVEGQRVGAYRILRRIGEGGMGTVYEAEQASPRRRVALKLIRARIGSHGGLTSRFRREVEVLGRLSHPGIAQIIEAGEADLGRGESHLYFSMELVEGLPLLEHAAAHGLTTTRDRLLLVARITDAVEHAHHLGVVHRDLKPPNILVGADGQPKVLDFGIARLTGDEPGEETAATVAGDVLGTVAYMSPEQIAGRTAEVDKRTDVHALGVLAFELVSGQRPYPVQGLPLASAARVIHDGEPLRLGDLHPEWRGDIETIVGKAIEKERERRYPSAAALAADIRRFLANQPIAARSPSTAYRLAKFARRNKVLMAILAAVLASLTLGLVLSTHFALQASDRARGARRESYRASLTATAAALREGDPMARVYLDRAPEDLRGWEWRVLSVQLDQSVRVLATPEAGRFLDLAFADAERSLVSVRSSGDAADPRILMVQDARSGAVRRSVSLPRDRPVLVRPAELAFARRHAVIARGEDAIEYRDAETGALLARDSFCGDRSVRREVLALAGDIAVVAGADERVLTCDLSTGRPVSPAGDAIWAPHGRVGLSGDGRQLAVLHGLEKSATDVTSGTFHAQLVDGRDEVMAVTFVAAGDRLATGSWNGQLRVWDVPGSALVQKHQLSTARLNRVVASPDGGRLAIADSDGLVWVWDLAQARVLASLAGHLGAVGQVAFSAGGDLLATSGEDGTVRLWDVSAERDLGVLRGHQSYVYPVCFSPDGARIYSEGWDGMVRVWDAETREPIATLRGGSHWDLAVSPDGLRLAEGHASVVRLFDTRTGDLLASRRDADAESWGKEINRLRWNRKGELTVVVAGPGGELQRVALEPGTLEILHPVGDPVSEWPPSPDGSVWVRLTPEGGIELRSSKDGRILRTLETRGVASPPGDERAGGRAWRPDGTGLAMGVGRNIHAWQAPRWTEVMVREAHVRRIHSLAFSPDGRRLASGGGDGIVKIWDAQTMELLLQLRGHDSYVWMLAWSPDGKQLVSSSGDRTLRVWDSVPRSERWQAREDRRRDREKARPMVEALFSALGEARRVADAVAARTAGEGERYRRAALDLVMTLAVERARRQPQDAGGAVRPQDPGPDSQEGRRPR